MRKRLLSLCLKIGLIINLLISATTSFAQVKNFKENQIIEVGRQQSFKIIKCRGEGAQQQCEVVYYVNNKQVGNSFWLMANQIRLQQKNVQPKLEKSVALKKDEKRKVAALKIGVAADDKKARIATAEPIKAGSEEDDANAAAQQTHTLTKTEKRDPQESIALRKERTISTELPVNNVALGILPITNVPAKDTIKALRIVQERQLETRAKSDIGSAKKLAVFIDCYANCDKSYLKSNLPIVDFVVSDRTVADVHVLINQQNTGGGGKALQMIFYGQGKYKADFDTLIVNLSSNSTEFEQRAEMLKGIKAGLVPYLFKANYSKYFDIKINLSETEAQKQVTATNDNWNYWVFGLGANGTLNSEQVYKDISISGDVFANRITDKLKLIFQLNGSYYKLNGSYSSIQYEVLNKDYSAQHSLVASLGNHWGIGYTTAYTINTFSNNKGRIYGKAGIEYSIFPYKDVNTRSITISYGPDIRANNYFDTTIYYKTKEVLFGQILQTYFSFTERWGNFNSLISYNAYLKDLSLNNLSARLSFNFRITGGLFFNIYASGSRVRDQVYLKKGAASEQDVLTRRLQLASEYNFYSGGGLNFRFGSKLNNFVNATLQNF